MTKTSWVRPKGPRCRDPVLGSASNLSKMWMADRSTQWGIAEVGLPGRALLKLIDTEAGRTAGELVREDMIDAVFWGSTPTLRLR